MHISSIKFSSDIKEKKSEAKSWKFKVSFQDNPFPCSVPPCCACALSTCLRKQTSDGRNLRPSLSKRPFNFRTHRNYRHREIPTRAAKWRAVRPALQRFSTFLTSSAYFPQRLDEIRSLVCKNSEISSN